MSKRLTRVLLLLGVVVALAAVAVPTVAGAKRTASDDRAAHARHGVHHSAKKTHRPKAKKAKWARKRSDDRAHAARRGEKYLHTKQGCSRLPSSSSDSTHRFSTVPI